MGRSDFCKQNSKTRCAPFSGASRGQEMVEFAIILPLLVLFLVGVFDLGRLFHAAIVVTNAAREGARYAMMYPDDIAGIDGAAVAEATSSGITLTTAMVSRLCPGGTCARGETVEVRVTFPFTWLLSGAVPLPAVQIERAVRMLVP